MKKLKNWLAIIFCSLFLLIFIIALIAIIPGMLTKDADEINMSTKEIISSIVGFVVLITLLIIWLRNGIKGLRKERAVEIIEFTGELNINFSGQITYTDYRNLVLGLTFKRPIYLWGIGVITLFLLSAFAYGITALTSFSPSYLVFLGLFIFVPITTIATIKKLYRTNQLFQEALTYKLDNDSIHIRGETMNTVQKWTHFYKISETKDFFLLYQGEAVATLLDKKMFIPNDVVTFQQVIKSLNVERG